MTLSMGGGGMAGLLCNVRVVSRINHLTDLVTAQIVDTVTV